MRKKLIAANWKMHKLIMDSVSFADILKDVNFRNKDVLICPPFTSLSEVSGTIVDSDILLGAQNMHYDDNGAYTGQISPTMLKDIGVTHVIIGHSEPRHIFNEDDKLINKKLKSALQHNLIPIFCVGELENERKEKRTEEVLTTQITEGLKGIKDISKIILAYEPVWAISGGDPNKPAATPRDAQDAHSFIRKLIKQNYGKVSEDIRILYGGSVKPENASKLMTQKDIDGALIGGASLDIEKFVKIIQY